MVEPWANYRSGRISSRPIGSLVELSSRLGEAQEAADTGDGDAYASALEGFDEQLNELSEVTAEFADRGYARLGATPGVDTGGPPLTGEEREVAAIVSQAQTSFRDGNSEFYCLARWPRFLDQRYGGRFGYQSCLDAGDDALEAEEPKLLEGADLTIEDVAIADGGDGDEGTVTANGEGDVQVEVTVTRNPPSDDVWRVDRIDGG